VKKLSAREESERLSYKEAQGDGLGQLTLMWLLHLFGEREC
jgi:hypothetical protein